jgi:hypothetical protein
VKRQVHDQERHVGHWVGEAEALVELDAVHDHQVFRRGFLREEVDVVQVQVAVRVARHAAFGPRLDERAVLRQGRLGERPQPVEDGRAQGGAD